MDSDRVSRWLTLAANFGVIVGIVFLVIELRQNTAIATAQARAEYAAGWRNVDASRQDESFSRVFSKSIENPEELSMNEVVQLDAYYSGVMDQMLTAQTAWNAGLRTVPFSVVAKNVAAIYFSNEFARSWWTHVRADWSSPPGNEFQETMDEAIFSAEPGRIQRIYSGIQRDMSNRATRTSN